MNYLNSILSPLHNCEEIAFHVCKLFGVRVTTASLRFSLSEHPDFPSLLSLSDVLQHYGIANTSLQVKEPEKLIKLQTPFVVQVKGEKTDSLLFAVVYAITSGQVEWSNPETHKKETISFYKFKALFTGYAQFYEVRANAGEIDYGIKLKKEKVSNFVNSALALSIPVLTLIISIAVFIVRGADGLYSILYVLITLVGAITGALLIFYEIDQHNPILQKVCTGGKRTNCAAILHSKGSKIFGIPWSVIGFSYFMGVLAVLLAGGVFDPQILSIAAWINVLTLPYIVYSVYYQRSVVKQWCPMCLTVQIALLLLFIISLAGGFLFVQSFSFYSVLPFIISIGIVFMAVHLLQSAIKKGKVAMQYSRRLQRLKYNPQIFETLLANQKKITESTDNIGITLGNPKGKIHLIKVCNPYCIPCSLTHPILDELLGNNPEIKLQIIYSVSEAENDYRNKPVKTLLTIAQTSTSEQIREALNNWYLPIEKDYESFNKQYYFDNSILEEKSRAIKKMREWCEKTEIKFTPTFFINDYQLPDIYTVEDLRYFLSV
jgi:Predicted membrane protein